MNQIIPYLVLAVIISSITTYLVTSISLEKTLKDSKSPITSDVAIVTDNQIKKESQNLDKSNIKNKTEGKLAITSEAAKPELNCSESCDDVNSCTYDYCNETTGFKCSHSVLRGDVDGCKGLVQGTCSKHSCVSGSCVLIYSSVCCGNGKCDADENSAFCPSDCSQASNQQTTTEQTLQTLQTESTTQNTQSQSLSLAISVAKNPIVRGNNQTITVKVTSGNIPVEVASVSGTVTYASGTTKKDFSGTTNSNGEYSYTWKIGGSSTTGIFSVTAISNKAVYISGSASTSFQVTSAS